MSGLTNFKSKKISLFSVSVEVSTRFQLRNEFNMQKDTDVTCYHRDGILLAAKIF